MSTYLVTGATGFVGGALARSLLGDGHRVVALVRDGEAPIGCDVVRGIVEDRVTVDRALSKFPLDAVFHLAAHAKVEACERDAYGTWESNVRGTYTLLDAVGGIPTVVATTDHVYGDSNLIHSEDDPFHVSRKVYDVSKSCADMIAQCYGRREGSDVRIVRCGNIYGPGDRDISRIVPSLIDDILHSRPPTIRSDGSPIREYLYVDDAVGAYRAVLDRGSRGEAYNFGGATLPVRTMANLITAEWNEYYGYRGTAAKPLILGTRGATEIDQIRLNDSKARSELGWEPCVDMAYGIRVTIGWWLSQGKDDL